MFGFVLLGALSHSVVLQINGAGAAARAPLPAQKANMPKQLRTSGSDLNAVLPRPAGISPLPVFNSEEDRDVCATAASVHGGQYICTWAI
jgi:hypothetical protein